jgi:hypothetical protein
VTWLYEGQELNEIPEGYIAFVYLITNKIDNKKYIGKKLFYFSKSKTVKGKKKKFKEESDWKTYWSSSDDLKADVSKLGEENFTREILHLCRNKGESTYLEAKQQFLNEVLENPDKWYNRNIMARVHASHVKNLQK